MCALRMKIFSEPSPTVELVQPHQLPIRDVPTRPWLSRMVRNGVDRLLALFALVFFAPFFLIVAVLVAMSDGWPIFYSQYRVGQGGRLFRCYKFRTMNRNADRLLDELLANDLTAQEEWRENQKLSNDPRVSCLGAFLRKTSLDELPQFWNVLKGDMAIVGPRPVVSSETWHYGHRIDEYTSVRPGITGLWQVSGRSDTSYDERVRLDCDYVARQSLLFDLSIMLKTVVVVLGRRGAR